MSIKAQNKYGDLSRLARALAEKNDADFKKGEVLQSILNLGYDRWRKTEGWAYHDMITWMKLEYGEFSALCILLGRYNYQVENGGHTQYYDNGYASKGRGKGVYFGGCNSSDIDIHDWMVQRFKKFDLHTTEIGKKIFEILMAFDVELEDDDEFSGAYDYHKVVDAAYLDKRYYEINGMWIEHLDRLVREAVQDFAEAA